MIKIRFGCQLRSPQKGTKTPSSPCWNFRSLVLRLRLNDPPLTARPHLAHAAPEETSGLVIDPEMLGPQLLEVKKNVKHHGSVPILAKLLEVLSSLLSFSFLFVVLSTNLEDQSSTFFGYGSTSKFWWRTNAWQTTNDSLVGHVSSIHFESTAMQCNRSVL